ncbi:Predicted ester cyclase [Rhizobiales bacterium GAS191]|nr:Predicted ester cyclase [Rhizobiales bacterium GAS113]SEE34908.1 Predicted ester cyclase [Rhizobiales bacterium GAS191]
MNTIERNKSKFKELIEDVINTGRLDLADRYLTADRPDYQDYGGLPPEMTKGHEGFKRVLGVFIEAFPDLHLEIEFMIGEGDRVAAYVSTTGTHKGPFLGAAPRGKAFKVNGVDILRFNDEGKVSAHWGAFNTLGMMAQLGIAPARQA